MFTPPARKSMSDIELQNALGASQADESGILAAMELLETQSALREQDNNEFNAWVEKLTQLGTPEALHAIENGRRIVAGLEPIAFESSAAEPVSDTQILSAPEEFDNVVDNSEPVVSSEQHAADISSGPIEVAAAHAANYDDEIAASLNALYAVPVPVTSAPTEAGPVTPEPAVETATQEPAVETDVSERSTEQSPIEQPFDELVSDEQLTDLVIEVPVAEQSILADSDFDQIIAPTEEQPAAALEPQSLKSHVASAEIQEQPTSTVKQSKAISQFWPWLAIGGTGFSVLMAFAINLMTDSATSGFFAIVVGLSLANIPVVAGAIAGKRSGLPSTFVSRAAFGVVANQLPAWVLQIVRFAAIVGSIVAAIYVFSIEVDGDATGLNIQPATVAVAGGAAVAAVLLALNYRFAKMVRVWLTAIGLAALIALAVLLAPQFSFANLNFAGFNQSQAWGAAAVVFAVFAGVWAPSAADYSRELAKSSKGLVIVGFTLLGTLVAPIAQTSLFYSVFAGASPSFKADLETGLASAVGSISPVAYVALAIAVTVALVSWLAAGLFSAKLSLAALGLGMSSKISLAIIAALALGAAIATVVVSSPAALIPQLNSFLAVFAIPTVVWAGIFSADVFLRRVAYHEVSLNRAYGFYKSVSIVNLVAWIILVAAGFGLFTEKVESGWALSNATGFLINLVPGFTDTIAQSGALLFILFGLAFLTPLVGTVARVKHQEREALALEARRDDLKDIFKFGE